MKFNSNTIGENIKTYRKRNGYTQTELGIKIGKSESTIRKYESGAVEPNFETLNKIASVLNISKYELLDYGEYLNKQIDDLIIKEEKENYDYKNILPEDSSNCFYNKNVDIISLSENESFRDTLDNLLTTYQFQNEFNINISQLTTTEKEKLKDNIYKYIKFICNEILTYKNNRK